MAMLRRTQYASDSVSAKRWINVSNRNTTGRENLHNRTENGVLWRTPYCYYHRRFAHIPPPAAYERQPSEMDMLRIEELELLRFQQEQEKKTSIL